MPGYNGTGPAGMGPMTGRGAGYCTGYGVSGYNDPAFGRGFGRSFGGGRGWGRGRCRAYYAGGFPGRGWFGAFAAPNRYPGPVRTPDPELEKHALRGQADALQSELDSINQRLGELETEKAVD